MNPWWKRPAADESEGLELPRRPLRQGGAITEPSTTTEEETQEEPETGEEPESRDDLPGAAPNQPASLSQSSELVDQEPPSLPLSSEPGVAEPEQEEQEEAVREEEREEEESASEKDPAEEAQAVRALEESPVEVATQAQAESSAEPEAQPDTKPRKRRRRRTGGRSTGDEAVVERGSVRSDARTLGRQYLTHAGESGEWTLSRENTPIAAPTEVAKIALFCDLENIAIGARDSNLTFDINLVLERLLDKGKIIVKRSYADWQRYSDFKRQFHSAGIEMVDIPQSYSGKNSADIKMVVDAMDLCYSKEHLDTFVILSGDSDFSPLVAKLKENDKHVIACGVKSSSSRLLIDSCDEFIYYEDLCRDARSSPKLDGLSEEKAEAMVFLRDAIKALIREDKSVLWGSLVKQTIQRKRPSFNESYYGYSSFSELLEDAERHNLIQLRKDSRSGSYVVTGFGS